MNIWLTSLSWRQGWAGLLGLISSVWLSVVTLLLMAVTLGCKYYYYVTLRHHLVTVTRWEWRERGDDETRTGHERDQRFRELEMFTPIWGFRKYQPYSLVTTLIVDVWLIDFSNIHESKAARFLPLQCVSALLWSPPALTPSPLSDVWCKYLPREMPESRDGLSLLSRYHGDAGN